MDIQSVYIISSCGRDQSFLDFGFLLIETFEQEKTKVQEIIDLIDIDTQNMGHKSKKKKKKKSKRETSEQIKEGGRQSQLRHRQSHFLFLL